ncbi:IPT/TIG domain-containing protein [Dokdonella ginsengisoli]|uniref:IPT/TIG domain-containing protein n=1 Tax=Dokdonella ginsengisoli TaxID=363846 RepID=A0ABV9QX32_9GAMM
MKTIRIDAYRLARLLLVAVLASFALPLSAQVNTWSWEPASGYPGKWHEAGVVWNPPDCCPNSFPNSATADARMNPYSTGYVGAADLDGRTYTVNRLRFTNISGGGNFTLTGNGGTLLLRGTTPYLQTGTQSGRLARIVGTRLDLADHTRFDMTVADDGLLVAADSSVAVAAPSRTADKTGPGVLVLAGSSAASQFAVQAGELAVEGSHGGGVSVSSGASLGGAGHVTGAVDVAGGGRLSPGAYDLASHSFGVGTLTVAAAVTLQAGSVFEVRVDGGSAGQLAAPGPVNLGGATLALSVGAAPPPGSVIRLIDNQGGGGIGGTFAGLAEGGTFSAGGIAFRISYAGGTGNDVVLSVADAPTVAGVAPALGPTAGGTSVAITGANFGGATAVSFGGTPAAFTVNSATQITATAPAHAAGAVAVAVTTAGGTGSAANAYTYVAAPAIAGVSPAQGPAAGGTSVAITGANFGGATTVSFDGTPATFAVNSATQITATAPAHAAGAVAIAVTTIGGTGSAANAYTYVAAPAITGVSPVQGPTAGGTSVTITGANFGGATAVSFGGTPAGAFTVNSATQITATAPAHAAGAVAIAVTTIGGSGSAANAYTYVPVPTVAGVSPAEGPLAGGSSVTIAGADLGGATSVTFGGTPAASFTVTNASAIVAITPAHAAGAVAVAVTTVGGNGSKADAYTYRAAPTVSAVEPDRGLISGGQPVAISGANLSGASAVNFGAVAAASFSVDDDSHIRAIAPAHVAGTVDVTVTTAGGTSAAGGAGQYTYVDPRRCHVRHDAAGADDGSSWTDAYVDLQSALTDASCTEVWVARGVYRPVTPADPQAVTEAERTATFRLVPGTKLYGGFAGDEIALDQRDPAARLTVLSGDLAGDDSGAVDGVDVDVPGDGSNGENSLHVASLDGVGLVVAADTVLDGFTITAGNGGSQSGGGLYCGSGAGAGRCNPTLSNLVFSANAADGGAAIAAASMAEASPVVSRVVFVNNRAAATDGGAVSLSYAQTVSAVFTDVVFRGNSARDAGALLLAAQGGGGAPVLERVTFADNRAERSGGAVRTFDVDLDLRNATFTGNVAATQGGGALAVNGGAVQLAHVTFSANTAAAGGAIHHDGGSLTLKNVIAWGDAAAQDAELHETASAGSASAVSDSVIDGGCPAAVACDGAVLTADPKLGPLGDHGGFTPTMLPGAGSSAIDTADDAGCADTDQRGRPRPQGAHCDIGATEVSLYALAVTVTTPNGSVASSDGAIAGCSGGGGTCSANYPAEGEGAPSSVTLTAAAEPHYHFAAWGGDCDADGSVTLDANRSCTASFAIDLHTVGGTASGLAGSGLEVRLNGGDAQTVSAADPHFTFAPIPDLGAWSVTVSAQPTAPWQTCMVDPATASGTLDGADVTDVAVDCTTNAYTVGGRVDGLLDLGSDLQLQLSAGDVQVATVTPGQTGFAFATPVASGTAYAVTVSQQPHGQSCTVDGGAGGTIAGADVLDVHVSCISVPQLELRIDDGQAYARYGGVVDYVVTLTNTGGPVDGVAVVSVLSPALDAAGATWVCYPGSVDAHCAAAGSGPLEDRVTIPAGRRLAFLLSVPVRLDAVQDTATAQAQADSTAVVTDVDALVIFRDGVDVPYGDGAQALPRDGAAAETFVLPPDPGPVVATVKHWHVEQSDVRVDRARLGAQDYVRLRISARGAERVSAWSPVRAGAALALARVDGVLLLEGAAGSLALDLMPEQGR